MMTEWYVKDLSELTQVSVQTLHHYDRIGLLKPSVRLENGYRLYAEKDLLTLQQIIALKFFGFKLAQIKTLLETDMDVIDHFSAQSRFLEEKAKTMLNASNALKAIIADCHRHQSIPWKTIIKLIEVYRMTQELEKTWVGKALNPEELENYARFSQELKTRFTPTDKQKVEKEWEDLVREIDANLDQDPASEIGMKLGKRCMDWVNSLYGKKYIHLRKTIWEKAFIGGHGGEEHGLSRQSVAWLDKAMKAHYSHRIYSILSDVNRVSHEESLAKWKAVLGEMYGDEQDLKKDFVKTIMLDDKVSQAAKDWLKKMSS
jgi:DNA-binding transcriptional MerR regulator